DGERAGVDVADRVDQAHHSAGAAQVEAGQGAFAEGVEVEEGVAGQHVLPVVEQPAVDLPLLFGGGVQLVPPVRASTGGAQSGDLQLGVVGVVDLLELVQLVLVLAGHDHRDLEAAHAGGGQVVHGPQRRAVGAGAADRVVHLCCGPVQGDLDVDVVGGGEPAGPFRSDPDAAGGELDAYVAGDGVVEEFPEVGADGGFAAIHVDVEDLHAGQLVEDRFDLPGGQLVRVAAARGRQAVLAGEVAGVGPCPGQADRGVQAVLELLDQGRDRLLVRWLRGDGHGAFPPFTKSVAGERSCRPPRARPGRAGSPAVAVRPPGRR